MIVPKSILYSIQDPLLGIRASATALSGDFLFECGKWCLQPGSNHERPLYDSWGEKDLAFGVRERPLYDSWRGKDLEFGIRAYSNYKLTYIHTYIYIERERERERERECAKFHYTIWTVRAT